MLSVHATLSAHIDGVLFNAYFNLVAKCGSASFFFPSPKHKTLPKLS